MEDNKPLSRRDFLTKGVQLAGSAFMMTSLGSFLTACGNAVTDSSGKVTGLVFQTWTIEAKEVIETQIGQLKKQFPNIDVALEIMSYDDYWKKIPISIAGGAGPDIFIMTRPNFEVFAKAGQALDITKEASASKELQANLAAMNPVFVDSYKYKGKTQGIPFGVDSVVVAVNKTMFQKEGLKPPTEMESTWTWDDLRSNAVKLTKRSGSDTTQYGYNIPTNRNPIFEYIWSNGGDIFNADGECVWASKEGLEAMTFLTDMMLKDKVSPTPTFAKSQKSDDLFLSGKIAMMHVGNGTIPKFRGIKDFEWDLVEIPLSPKTKKRVVSTNVLGYIVGPNAKAKPEIMHFLEQLTSQESQKVYADKGVFIPTRKDAQDPYFADPVPKNLKSFQRALAYAKPMILSEYVPYTDVVRVITNYTEQIFGGSMDVVKGWTAAQDELNKIYKENKAKG
ncbi:ABC transporter substrate-binding protein [Paenibacillus cremeus]|uniref:Sugar ABC transporter substrate-binding protein n=1 Tax=Paenibacillus cremeus TaxID=2163881 RepID=A0A559K5B0_9BACL|nr:sugar ABC transporter substrate-binding protein [Paenibacillus cremeus]TVY07331.1 sugar ABC transporter substrate-binding protein [Paenibacillus cremeus]